MPPATCTSPTGQACRSCTGCSSPQHGLSFVRQLPAPALVCATEELCGRVTLPKKWRDPDLPDNVPPLVHSAPAVEGPNDGERATDKVASLRGGDAASGCFSFSTAGGDRVCGVGAVVAEHEV